MIFDRQEVHSKIFLPSLTSDSAKNSLMAEQEDKNTDKIIRKINEYFS